MTGLTLRRRSVGVPSNEGLRKVEHNDIVILISRSTGVSTGSSLRSITFTVNGVSVCRGIRSRFETGILRIIIIMEFLVSKRSNAACRKHQTR